MPFHTARLTGREKDSSEKEETPLTPTQLKPDARTAQEKSPDVTPEMTPLVTPTLSEDMGVSRGGDPYDPEQIRQRILAWQKTLSESFEEPPKPPSYEPMGCVIIQPDDYHLLLRWAEYIRPRYLESMLAEDEILEHLLVDTGNKSSLMEQPPESIISDHAKISMKLLLYAIETRNLTRELIYKFVVRHETYPCRKDFAVMLLNPVVQTYITEGADVEEALARLKSIYKTISQPMARRDRNKAFNASYHLFQVFHANLPEKGVPFSNLIQNTLNTYWPDQISAEKVRETMTKSRP